MHSKINIIVNAKNRNHLTCDLFDKEFYFPAIIGKNFSSKNKIEGDLKTPLGKFKLVCGYYRADKINLPRTSFPFFQITKKSSWCCDPTSKDYNNYIIYDNNPKNELLWRDDEAYDIFLVIDYNIDPTIANKGSAIFFHLLKDSNKLNLQEQYTEGCVAIHKKHMLEIIPYFLKDMSFTIK